MKRLFFVLAVCAAFAAGCKKEENAGTAPASGNIDLQGAGATFPYPLYSKWVAEYQKLHPDVRINYQSIGSGGGIRQVTEKTVDFGASDAPMSDAELQKAPGKLLHIPTTLGAVVVTFNLQGVTALQLTPELVAGIFLGEITKWNDPKLAAANPEAKLPDAAITVAYRSDGSGTTAVFTDYLARISPAWKEKVGAGKSVKFPVGLGAKGNEGVAGQIKTSPGTVGYVELAYAKQNNLTFASIKNKAGKFATPELGGVSSAAAGALANMPEDFRVSITDAGGDAAYPISSFTYILLYEDQQDARKGGALVNFLWWAVHDGQKFDADLFYAPLPAELVTKVEAKLKGVTSGGKALLAGGG
ncbi:MAG TPA: phosphate ABC transporter substrate-binding protein PstS [Myxococcaceae bacterium]|nr:phosphate ABC transporter substrate-binding protein PstS [Myxococcaceae bacterium]